MAAAAKKRFLKILSAESFLSLRHFLAANNAEDQRIITYIEQYSKDNPQIGRILSDIWFELKFNPEDYRNKDAFAVVQERVRAVLDKAVEEFAAKWSLNPEELKAYAINTPVSEIDPARVNTAMGNYKAYKEAGGTGSKLVYLKELRQAVADFVTQEIKPLLRA